MKHEINDQIDCETKPLLDFLFFYIVYHLLFYVCMWHSVIDLFFMLSCGTYMGVHGE